MSKKRKQKKNGFLIVCTSVLLLALLASIALISVVIYNDTHSPELTAQPELKTEPLPKQVTETTPEPKSIVEPKSTPTPTGTPDTKPETEAEPKSDDPYGMYIVTEDWLKGSTGFCVERDGKLYSVGSYVPTDVIDKYDVGYDVTGSSELVSLFARDYHKMIDLPTSEPYACISVGEIPILEISKSEKIRGYNMTQLDLYKTEFLGYTIDVVKIQQVVYPILNHNRTQEDALISGYRKSNQGVVDMNDQPVYDFRNLAYGKKYKYYWYVGTEYQEAIKTANCKAYRWLESGDMRGTVFIDGTLTKSGYAEFDLSQLECGTYLNMHCSTVFELVD